MKIHEELAQSTKTDSCPMVENHAVIGQVLPRLEHVGNGQILEAIDVAVEPWAPRPLE